MDFGLRTKGLRENNLKFVADVMLGRLARLMRFSGYDVEYDSRAADDDLLKKSGRKMLLTKDRGLAKRASEKHLYFVTTVGAINQLKEIQKQFPLPAVVAARCLVCNLRIRRIAKSKVQHLVPPYVFAVRNEFTICPQCKKIYWQGTHFEHMLRMIK